MKNKIISIILMLIILIIPTAASADISDYGYASKLIGGPKGTYFVSTKCYTLSDPNSGIVYNFKDLIYKAINNWNTCGSSTKVSFTETTTINDTTKIRFEFDESIGSNYGRTLFYNSDGKCLNRDGTGAPTAQYTYVVIKLNPKLLVGMSGAFIMKVIAHEIGHAISLDHNPEPKALMYKDAAFTSTTYVTQYDIKVLDAIWKGIA